VHYQIVHFTTVHPRTDTRIRIKEVTALVEHLNTDVGLFVQDGLGNEHPNNGRVHIIDTGRRPRLRIFRMTLGVYRMLRAVRKARPVIAHFHDPELIPAGILLKLSGAKVVYDVHEHVPRQILSKHWIPVWLRWPSGWLAGAFEWLAGKHFDGIVSATPTIARRFPAKKTISVQNFPILGELITSDPVPYQNRSPHFAYVGGITGIRGSREMVEAIGILANENARLQLAGVFSPDSHGDDLAALDGWRRVEFKGWANRSEVTVMLSEVRAGLVVLHPTMNYLDAYPVKMFEYMAAGLPVIASDFPLWREIVDGAGCGLLVNPNNSRSIADAMQWILEHPEEAEAMGRRGREAVEGRYNWTPEADKLVSLYRRLLDV
jgi:hypothetical protein